MIAGLQTHNITRPKWIPPRGRFWSLQPKDEQWARPLGLGRVEHKKEPLYDVRRYPDERLVGYTSHDPAYYTYRSELTLRVATECLRVTRHIHDELHAAEMPIETVTVRVMKVHVSGQSFACWYCQALDAEALIRVGWIETLGEDNMERFAYEARLAALRDTHPSFFIPPTPQR